MVTKNGWYSISCRIFLFVLSLFFVSETRIYIIRKTGGFCVVHNFNFFSRIMGSIKHDQKMNFRRVGNFFWTVAKGLTQRVQRTVMDNTGMKKNFLLGVYPAFYFAILGEITERNFPLKYNISHVRSLVHSRNIVIGEIMKVPRIKIISTLYVRACDALKLRSRV